MAIVNLRIAADNKLLKEIKARITRLYNWSKEQSAQSQGRESITDFLFRHRQDTTPTSRYGKVKALQADAKLFNFLMENGITSMEQLYEKVSAMNSDYYDLRGKIVSKERRISILTERLEMWAQYQKYKPNLKNNLSGVSESARIFGRYGNVFLSEAEVAELQADFPTVWQEYIERLSEYMASTGKTYKSHAATIRRWAKEDKRKGKGVADYSCKEGESL